MIIIIENTARASRWVIDPVISPREKSLMASTECVYGRIIIGMDTLVGSLSISTNNAEKKIDDAITVIIDEAIWADLTVALLTMIGSESASVESIVR